MSRPSTAYLPLPLPLEAAALMAALQLFEQLPQHVRQRAVRPRYARMAVERSLCAIRLRAFDADGRLCLYQHAFTLADVDFDAEDSPYVRVSLQELLTAVRTPANTWLQRTQRCASEWSRLEDSGYRLAPHFVEP